MAVFRHQEHGTVAGVITSATYTGRDPRGNIPNYSIQVKGRSGKTATVDLINQYTQTYPSWEKALDVIKKGNR